MSLANIPDVSTVLVDPSIPFHALITPEKLLRTERRHLDFEEDGKKKHQHVVDTFFYKGRNINDDCRSFLGRVANGNIRGLMTTYQITGLWQRLTAFQAHASEKAQTEDIDLVAMRPHDNERLTDDFASRKLDLLLRSNIEVLPVLSRDHRLAIKLCRRFSIGMLDAINVAAAMRVMSPTVKIATTTDRFRAVWDFRRIQVYLVPVTPEDSDSEYFEKVIGPAE